MYSLYMLLHVYVLSWMLHLAVCPTEFGIVDGNVISVDLKMSASIPRSFIFQAITWKLFKAAIFKNVPTRKMHSGE